MLTVVSTVAGLFSFLTDGPTEVFWFSLAVGTIGGMLFSILALIFIFPVVVVPPVRRQKAVLTDAAAK